MITYKQHTWRHAQSSDDAFWKCTDCNKLDFNSIPDTDETCSGSISKRIDDEILKHERKSTDDEIARLRELLAETLVTLKRMTTDEFSKGADKAIREKIENELGLQ